ncbi:hypothetical protein I5I86_05135, partial [Pseudomonas aeruginosa]|nr:hypothetical protein [Pseudomonas aeruginosa]
MHTLYWRDLESPANGEWLGLAVQVEGGPPGGRPAHAGIACVLLRGNG